MGKGDRRTRRGKIYAGSFGKSRPKDPKRGTTKPRAATPAPAASRPAAKPAPRAPRKAKS